jgi:putative ABC transport system permease protein
MFVILLGIYIKQENSVDDFQEKIKANGLFADPDFFNIFSYKLLEGNSSEVLKNEWTIVLGNTFAHKIFGDEEPIFQMTCNFSLLRMPILM